MMRFRKILRYYGVLRGYEGRVSQPAPRKSLRNARADIRVCPYINLYSVKHLYLGLFLPFLEASTFCMVLPISAGLLVTVTPAADSESILSCALPEAPVIMAPA